MSLQFVFGDFDTDLVVPTLPFTSQLTCQAIYDHVASIIGDLAIAFQHEGKMILMDRTWNAQECFPTIGHYQLFLYSNKLQPTQTPPYRMVQNSISIIIKMNENIIQQISPQLTQTLNDVYNQLEILPGFEIVGLQLFDSRGVEIVYDQGAPLSQYIAFPQPLTMILITQLISTNQEQQSKVIVEVFINGAHIFQAQADANTQLLELIQQTQIPHNQIIRAYGLYDASSTLLANTDIKIEEFKNCTQPLLLNIETSENHQQPVVQFQLFVNGNMSVLSTFESDKTLLEVINSTQISQGETIDGFALCDASSQSIQVSLQTPLQEFVACTQPLQLYIKTIQPQIEQYQQREQSVVCLKIYIDSQKEITQNVIASQKLFDILNELTIPKGQIIQSFCLVDASNQQLTTDPNLQLLSFVNYTQPLAIWVVTSMLTKTLNVYVNKDPYYQYTVNSSNKLSDFLSQINIPEQNAITDYILLDAQQVTLTKNLDAQFEQLWNNKDPFSLLVTISSKQLKLLEPIKKKSIRIIEVVQKSQASLEIQPVNQQAQQQSMQPQQTQNQIYVANNQQIGYQPQNQFSQVIQQIGYQNQPQNQFQQVIQQQQITPIQQYEIQYFRNLNDRNYPQTLVQRKQQIDQNVQRPSSEIQNFQPGFQQQQQDSVLPIRNLQLQQEVQQYKEKQPLNSQPIFPQQQIIQPQPQNLNVQQAFTPQQPEQQIIQQDVSGTQAVSPAQKRKFAMESLQILKNITLIIDESGEFVIYQFHHPTQVKGRLLKEMSKPKPDFNRSVHKWIEVNKIQYAQTGDKSFAIQWDNGNISKVKLLLL